MKVGVIGAGVSGLAISKILTDVGYDVEILEKNSSFGGIARTKKVQGFTYHMIGGHCFNSKHADVLDFVFNKVMPISEWNKITRKADIYFKNNIINYPIEYSLNKIFSFDEELALNITSDFLRVNDHKKSANLEEWFINNFGKTLAEEYFIPYNEKIWGMKLTDMSPDWVSTKLPMPNKDDFLRGIFAKASDNMPHATFYYPKSNDQMTFINSLAVGSNITMNYEVNKIVKENGSWIVNDEKSYDILINTSPLDTILHVLNNVPEDVLSSSKKLKYNKISTMLWKTKEVNSTWTYDPSPSTPFHRHIHIGQFFTPSENLTITEAVGELSYDEMKQAGEKVDYLIEPIDYNVSGRAYVLFDNNYEESKNKVIDYLNTEGICSLGRFGEWEYFNMDVCIKSALDLSKKIIGDSK